MKNAAAKNAAASFLLCGIAALPAGLVGQPAATQPSAPPAFVSQSSVVIVPALVRGRSGELVFDLKADDFLLTDNGVPQHITLDADRGSEPLALVVVVEVGAAGARELGKLASLPTMLESLTGAVPHRIALVAFADTPVLLRGFTTSAPQASGALSDLITACVGHDRSGACPDISAEHPQGENGAAILDSLAFAVDLLRSQPAGFRRAVLLISETLDRGSQVSLENAVRAIGQTNTGVYAIAFSTARSEATHYAYHTLPIQPGWALSNKYPNPPHGCMGKDPEKDPDGPHNKLSQAYDCLVQLVPPLGLAKMAALATADVLQRNVPETVARMTGGEYFQLGDARSLERSLATIANHIPNRYEISFQPQSPHAGLHIIALRMPGYDGIQITARRAYWADPEIMSVQAGASAPH